MPVGPDKYPSMTALYADPANVEGQVWAKRYRRHTSVDTSVSGGGYFTDIAVIAPHGGGIEKGTSELCLATAGYHPADYRYVGQGNLYDYFLFEGLLSSGNGDLHVTSSNYDDPHAQMICRGVKKVFAIHGCRDEQTSNLEIHVGGLDLNGINILVEELSAHGIPAIHTSDDMLNGDLPENLTNLGYSGAGVQVEIPTSVREGIFDNSVGAINRVKTTNRKFWNMVNAYWNFLKRWQ